MSMQQPALLQFLQQLVDTEIKPSFQPPAELAVDGYSQDIFRRFQNPAVRHLLAQIAWDGSQKLPMRLLPIIQDNLAAGRPVAQLALAVAAWCRFIRLRAGQQPAQPLVDPLSARLLAVAAQCSNDAGDRRALFFSHRRSIPSQAGAGSAFCGGVTAGLSATGSVTPFDLSTTAASAASRKCRHDRFIPLC